MPQLTFTGHPLHPQMIVMPAGLLPFSLGLDLMHLQTGNRSYADAAYYTMMGGFVGGLAAGAAGAADFLTIPEDSPAKGIGKLHGSLNVALLGLTGFNLLLRRRRRDSPQALPVLLSLVGNVGLFVSAWYGGHLVYEHGVRVKPAGESSPAPEMKLPGDEQVEEALKRLSDQLGLKGA
jgi:uncharacterized membrane protein